MSESSGNDYYDAVQNLSSRLLSKNVKIKIYKTMILPVVLPKRDEVTGGWRKLQNEELHNL
jgi:hypothetical protein